MSQFAVKVKDESLQIKILTFPEPDSQNWKVKS